MLYPVGGCVSVRMNLCLGLAWLCCVCFVCPPSAHAAPAPLHQPASGVDERSYKLQVGDELELSFFALPALEKKCVIRADGRFCHSALGEVRARGLTLAQLQREIQRRARTELKNPSFHLGLLSYGKSEIAVLGEVGHQGKFPILPGASVLDVVAQAGGLNDKADPESASLLRGGKSIDIDLRPPSGDKIASMKLETGDILYIHAGNRISVAGEVQKPGIYAISRKSTNPVADALKAAGGAKSSSALQRVRLLRPTVAGPIIISAMPNKDGQMSKEAQTLQDGDTLVIPERQAVVLGASGKQGAVALHGGETLFDVVSANGVGEKAELNRVIVVRAEDVRAGRGKREEYNLQSFFKDRKDTTPVPIYDGDLVYIPSRGDSKSLLDSSNGLLQMLFLARALII